MTEPADLIADPVFVLESCLQERSGGSMTAALRDIWQMACRRNFAGNYDDARRPPAAIDRYDLVESLDWPIMVGPASGNCTRPDKSLWELGSILTAWGSDQMIPGSPRLNCPRHITVRIIPGAPRLELYPKRHGYIYRSPARCVGHAGPPGRRGPPLCDASASCAGPTARVHRAARDDHSASAGRAPHSRQNRPSCQRACDPHLSAGVSGRGSARHVTTRNHRTATILYHAGVTPSSGNMAGSEI